MTTASPTQQRFSQWLIVIPARLKSERLPNKPLADLNGKPLIVRVYENLSPLFKEGAHIVVAVDHEATAKVCTEANVPWVMTKESHQSGTDRCCEVAIVKTKFPFILNVQGDEPFVDCNDLMTLMSAMASNQHPMGTLGIRQTLWEDFTNPNIVKIVMAQDQTAIYFSRATVPFDRDASRSNTRTVNFIRHLGVYAFRRENLMRFCELPPSELEQTEKLEQLRAVSQGWKIYVSQAKHHSIGIDTPDDLEAARRKMNG